MDAEPRVHAVLYPFLEHTEQAAANHVLFRYIQYHMQLGFSRFYQYTQARLWERRRVMLSCLKNTDPLC